MTQLTLQRAADGFVLAREAEGKSPNTIRWYRYNFAKFIQWRTSQHVGDKAGDVTANHVREYLKFLREPHEFFAGHRFKPKQITQASAQQSVHGAHRALNALFNWCIAEKLLTESPMVNIKRPKLAKTLVPLFTREQIEALLKACAHAEDECLISRNRAIILFLVDTGVRIDELISLSLDRVLLNEGSATVKGKGSKDRKVFFGAQCKKALWQYVTLYRSQDEFAGKSLFLNRDSTPMKYRRLARTLEALGRRADVDDVHPHRFRHTAAVEFLRNGGNVFALQMMLGHSTLEMVKHYVELSQQDVQRVHKTASPADNWKLA